MRRAFALAVVAALVVTVLGYRRARLAGRDFELAERCVGAGDLALRDRPPDLPEAARRYSSALSYDPEDARAFLGLARTRLRTTDTIWAALPYYLKAADLAAADTAPPRPPDVELAERFIMAGDDHLAARARPFARALALEAYVRAALANHSAPEPYAGIAQVLDGLHYDPHTVLRYYREALRRAPYDPQVHYELARLYLEIGALDPALQHARYARKAGPREDAAELIDKIKQRRAEN
jgi:tetratricopeptide (TPR) repeat protein